ncbi:unnamed protein product [Paramecium octaurelia]|uniref:GST C-terminal domain-containing protein n=1 Tax=Paramecium octaurelia TaxID=43137 RepID=A0A8S1V1K5_PAROT|nr:unnamed protein product [Paramecium octaurelia]CAD8170387.1 unnamed protein product [Paramecium octaurelia]
MELFLSSDLNSQFLTLLAHYTRLVTTGRVKLVVLSHQALKLNEEGVLKFPSIPSLVTEDAQILTNVFSIAQYLTNISFTEQILIGADNQTLGQVLQVFEAQRKIQGEELIEAFLKHLESRVFFVTNHVTLADLFLYIHTYDIVSTWNDEQKVGKYVHFFRWFKQVQALPQIAEINKTLGRVDVKPASPFADISSTSKQKKQK